MADVPVRARKRDKFKRRLGLDKPASYQAPTQSPNSGTSRIAALPKDVRASTTTASNDVGSSVEVLDPSASRIATPETQALAQDRSLDPAGAATSSSANTSNNLPSSPATLESAHLRNSSPTAIPSSTNKPQPRDLWADALQKLSSEDREVIEGLRLGSTIQKPVSESISELLTLTTNVQDECKARSYKIRFRGNEIILRDVVGKTIFWLNKFKEVGDIAVNFDPIHASLPWAGVRFLLQAAIAEHDQMGDLVIATEKCSFLISRGAIYERLYLPGVIADDAVANLHDVLIQLYAEALRILALCHRMFVKNTAKRAVHAIFQPGHVSELLDKCEKLEMQVEYEAHNCERARSQDADEKSKRLLEILKEPILRTDQNVLSLLEKVDEKERLDMLDWTSKVLYGLNHQTVKEKRTTNTCEWLLDHSQYQEWQDTSASMILWLCGNAGTGKTFLTSKVIDEVQTCLDSKSNQEGFAFFYCNRNEAERREPLSMLRAFVRQLSTTRSEKHSIQKRLKNFYSDRRLMASELTMEDCKGLLLELVNIYPRTTLIIDALDECEKHKRLELIVALDYVLAQASNPVKIFISSRPDGDIKERLKDRANIEIDATKNQDDVSRFVNAEIVKHRRWKNMPPRLQARIVETLQEQSQGMFQWAYLQIKQLLDLNRPIEIERRLGKLPEDLKQAYDEIYNGMGEHEKEIADRAFQWIMCARHPLTTVELLPAICQDGNSDTLLPLDGLDEDILLEYCHNLLVIDPVRQVWIPSHLSVIEYLEKHLWSQAEANFLVLKVSLLVLHNTMFYNREESWAMKEEDSTREETVHELQTSREPNLEDYPHGSSDCSSPAVRIAIYDPLFTHEFRALSYYVRHNWMLHAQKSVVTDSSDRLFTLLNLFLGQPNNSSATYRCWLNMTVKDKPDYGSAIRDKGLTPIDLLRLVQDPEVSDCSVAGFAYCAFDFARILPNWHAFNWIGDERTAKRKSYLELAVSFGATHTCMELVKHGAEVNEQTGSNYGSAVAAAAGEGWQEIVEFLVKEAGADVNMQGGNCGSALAAAVRSNEQEIVDFLVEKGGAEVNMQLQYGGYGSVLACAAYWGRREMFEYLVKEGGAEVNLQLQYGDYGSALAAAACWEGKEAIDFLIKEGGAEVNLQLQYGDYGSTLAAAAYWGEKDIVEYLVKEGGAEVNLQLQNGDYGSALAAAAYSGEKETVKYLVKEGGAEVNLQLQYGKYANALEAAEEGFGGPDPETVKLLIELGAKRQV